MGFAGEAQQGHFCDIFPSITLRFYQKRKALSEVFLLSIVNIVYEDYLNYNGADNSQIKQIF